MPEQGPRIEAYYPALDRGAWPLAPHRSLVPGNQSPAIWRDLLNLRPHDGALHRRETLEELPAGMSPPSVDLNTAGVNDQIPLLIQTFTDPTNFGNDKLLVVTNREIFIHVNSTWYNLTPVHSTGTVSITSGTTVTGSGTAWADRGIIPGNLIQLDGTWYAIASVTDNTHLELATSYSGSTLSGDSYSIRRTFLAAGVDSNLLPVFWQELNGDLILAGFFGTVPAVGWGLCGVIKITGGADPAKTSFSAASDTSYLFVGGNVEVETGVAYVSQDIVISGLVVLDDGRIVVGGRYLDSGAGGNRIWYSSLTDVTVWTASPGGFTDPINRNLGQLTAMIPFGRSVAVHFHRGVVMAEPTGQVDPPLAFYQTAASIGAYQPRLIANVDGGNAVPRGQLFVGYDNRIHVFDGNSTRSVLSGAEERLRRYSNDTLGYFSFIWVNRPRQEARIMLALDVGASEPYGGTPDSMEELVINFDTGTFYRNKYAALIGAVSGESLTWGSFDAYTRQEVQMVGTPSYYNSASRDMLHMLRQNAAAADSTETIGNSSGRDAIRGETEDLDFGYPGEEKVIESVEVTVKGDVNTSATLTVSASSDGGSTWTDHTVAVSGLSSFKEGVFYAWPAAKPGERWRFRIGPNDDNTLGVALKSLRIVAVVVAHGRAA